MLKHLRINDYLILLDDLEIAEDKYEKAKNDLEATVAELTDLGV